MSRATPLIQLMPVEVELAPRTVLMSRDHALGGELPQRVAVHAEVLGRLACVQPVCRLLAGVSLGALDQSIYDQICDLAQQAVEQVGISLAGERSDAA